MASTIPEYLPLDDFARLIGTSRPTLTKAVRMGLKPSAFVKKRALFAVRDLPRVKKELEGK